MFKKIFSGLIIAATVFTSAGTAFADFPNGMTEQEAYIAATVEATCHILSADDLLDPVLETEAEAIYSSYGFDAENDAAMEEVAGKYQNDQATTDAIMAGLDEECGDTIMQVFAHPEGLTEEEAYIDASVEAACHFVEADDIFDPDLEDEIMAIYFSYGFNNEAEVYALTVEYEDNQEVQSTILKDTYLHCGEALLEAVNSSASGEFEQIFPDVVLTHKNAVAIYYLYNSGIINGYPDGTFKPERKINRAEFLKILVEGRGITPDVSTYSNCYPDVKEDWYAPYVCYATEQGWVQGYPDGRFIPAQTINKVEALKMILEVNSELADFPDYQYPGLYSDVNAGDWFEQYVYQAKAMGLTTEEGYLFAPGEMMTRAEICEYMYRLMVWLGVNSL